jgi:dihydromonapterin reductase/dihydrofolate reductase
MKLGVILITGVGKRIGLSLAKECLSKGYAVIGTYRTKYPALDDLEKLGAELYHCDFQNDAQVKKLILDVTSKYESLRAVIHNASDWLPDSDNLDESMDLIRMMMNVHVNVPYIINQAFEPLLCANSDGISDIIHITDYVADTGSKKHIAYAASKAAAESLVSSYAAKLAPYVTVNAIAPALILFNDNDSESYRQKALAKSVMAREGGLNEITEAVDYLLGSEYMTGRTIHLDGGRHLK